MKKNNRVFGAIGVKCLNANWNADFTGNPKSFYDGTIYGSDVSLKYSFRNKWKLDDETVLYFKEYEGKDLKLKKLEDKYADLFFTKDKEKHNKEQTILNLYKAIDVKNFGATYTPSNISIEGVVQIGQGENIYDKYNVEVITQDIISPNAVVNGGNDSVDKNGNKKEAKQTVGKHTFARELHYCYPIAVNPIQCNKFNIEGFEGYTEEDYNKFKETSLVCATTLNSRQKMGCENEYAIFIEFKENSQCGISNLQQYIQVYKDENEEIVIDITKLDKLLNLFDNEIEKIEIYYNNILSELKTNYKNNKVKIYNIFTKTEV